MGCKANFIKSSLIYIFIKFPSINFQGTEEDNKENSELLLQKNNEYESNDQIPGDDTSSNENTV